MKTGTSLKNQQGGAVAVMVAAGLVMIIGFLALVMDLGHLYLARTGQQNAADAAALAGAKELDGSQAGIDNAVAWAQKLTAQGSGDNTGKRNQFFGGLGWEDVVLNQADIHFSDSPYSSDWKNMADAKNQPASLYFIKVDTRSGDMDTWFARIWNIFFTSTYGSAVAGRFMTPITPIGVCALRADREAWVQYESGGDRYKVELGYMRGVSYDLMSINNTLSGLAPGTALYVHPTATTDAGCQTSQGNADFAAPFLCTGRSAISGGAGSTVYTNTGLAAGKSISALNTRFDQYGPPLDSSLDRTVCPPDANIREYQPGPPVNGAATNWMIPKPEQMAAYGLENWLAGPPGTNVVRNPLTTPPPAVVNANINAGGCGGNCDDNYGVLWSYTRPVRPSGSFAPTDWPTLYPTGPTSPAYVEPSPYWYGLANQGNPIYFRAPTPAVSQSPNPRRVLNVVIVQCPAPSGGICRPLTVLGVGRFFMQRTANVSGWIAGEFAGLVPEAELSQDIRLYR